MGFLTSGKWAKVAVACVASFSLSGCLILPGEFVSDMTVRRNGDFSFSYKGQIQLLGLANLLNNEVLSGSENAEFNPVCYKEAAEVDQEKADAALKTMRGDAKSSAATATAEEDAELVQKETKDDSDTASAAEAAAEAVAAAAEAAAEAASWEMEERDCTKEEIAQQKKEWDEQQAAKMKEEAQAKKMAEMLLGGIDPKNPDSIKRFTREVERLAAWHKVEHVGNGVFMVDYSTSGRLADDFAFPVIPRYAIGEPMIHITRWDNGRLRVEAPAFKTDPELSFTALMGMGSLAGMMGTAGAGKKPADPITIKGIFTLTTDARILANNTEDGPETVAAMEKLSWDIGPASYGAPMALLKLAN